ARVRTRPAIPSRTNRGSANRRPRRPTSEGISGSTAAHNSSEITPTRVIGPIVAANTPNHWETRPRNATTGFRSTVPISGSSMSCASTGPMTSSTKGWPGCCRSTRRWWAHISTPPVRPLPTTQGAESNYKNSAIAEPDDHALGRSRGGLTTKIHALTDTATCPVAMTLTPGQAGDNPALLPLVDGYFGADATADAVGDVRLLA